MLKSSHSVKREVPVLFSKNACLHSITAAILTLFSILVTLNQYLGKAIECMTNERNGVPEERIIQTYCWMHPTFTIPDRMASEVVGRDVAHPGVGPQREGDSVRHQKYYQWVSIVLIIQALFFYFPRYLWKRLEGGKMEILILDLNSPIIKKKAYGKVILVADHITNNLHSQNIYAIHFFICEVMNFINVVGQIYFINHFLGGEFVTYGSDIFRMTWLEPEERVDPMAKVTHFLSHFCIYELNQNSFFSYAFI